jgi:hypothetical protein
MRVAIPPAITQNASLPCFSASSPRRANRSSPRFGASLISPGAGARFGDAVARVASMLGVSFGEGMRETLEAFRRKSVRGELLSRGSVELRQRGVQVVTSHVGAHATA